MLVSSVQHPRTGMSDCDSTCSLPRVRATHADPLFLTDPSQRHRSQTNAFFSSVLSGYIEIFHVALVVEVFICQFPVSFP